MPITLDACPVCHTAIPAPPAAAICRHCGWEAAVPNPATWPRELKKKLFARYFREVLCAAGASERQGWERLLLGAYRGHHVELEGRKRFVAWAATLQECWAIAQADLAEDAASARATTTSSPTEG